MNSYPQQDVKLFYNNTGISRYPVTFEYDEEDQVVVRSWDSLTNQYTGVLNQGTDYVFDGPTNIVFLIPVPEKFTIFRQTRINQSYGTSRYSAFQQGNAIRASDLNGNFELLRLAIQENIGNIDDNDTDLTDLTNALNQEITDRTEGDANLQSQIDDIETDVNNIQTGKVNSVTGTAPVVSSGGLDPVISMPAASSSQDGYMSAADKRKLDAALDNGDGYIRLTDVPELQTIIPLDADAGLQLPDQTSASGYEVEGAVRYNTTTDRIEVYDTAWSGVAGGAEIQTSPPANASPGDLWWDSEEGRGYVYYNDGDSNQWVESNPSWNGSIPDGTVTPAKLSTGGPSWNTSGDLDVSGGASSEQLTVGLAPPSEFNNAFGLTKSDWFLSIENQTILDNPSGYTLFRGDDRNGATVFNVFANGSATFAGAVTVSTLYGSTYPLAVRTLNTNGTFASGFKWDHNGYLDLYGNGNESSHTIRLLAAEGRAVLQGGILASGGNISIGYYGAGQVAGNSALFGSGTAGQYSSILDNTGITGWDQVNRQAVVFPNGTQGANGRNLEVYGGLQINTEPDNDANYTVTDTEEYEEQEELTPYVPAVPATYDEYGNELTAEVPEVPATYQTVTKTRNIRTYTGPTLDVKERLLNLISRLDALEADEIIDDSNSSALLQLVHNLSARLDLRDQQIADLTNRIQTLELN